MNHEAQYIGIAWDRSPESVLFCEVQEDGYWIINGAWLMPFESPYHDMHWHVVIEDMDDFDGDYHEACTLIADVATGRKEYLSRSERLNNDYAKLYDTENEFEWQDRRSNG